MVKGPTTQISPLKTRSKNYIGFTSASEAGFTTSKATGTGLKSDEYWDVQVVRAFQGW